MPTLADLLRNDPWGTPPQTPLAKTVTDVGFDPSLGFAGAVQTYLSRLKKMQGGLAQDMLDTAADPNAEGIQRAANLLGGLGLKIANVPMALMPSSQELRDRGYQAGASPEVQALGGALGDAVNIPEPASVGTLLAGLGKAAVGAKGLAGAAAMAGKSAAVAPLGKALEEAAILKQWTKPSILGEEINAYHGTGAGFDEFAVPSNKHTKGAGSTESPIGIWTTDNPDAASSFADFSARGEGANVRPVAVRFKNPLEVKDYKDIKDLVDQFTTFERPGYMVGGRQIRMMNDKVDYDALRKYLADKGHDGIVLRETMTDSPTDKPIGQFISFDPASIKPRFGGAEAAQTGGQASSVSREQALNGLTGQGGIIAYHGSPHSFDKFDMSKIGTGEGAQAYGHGLYFAEKEGVAKDYRNKLAPPEVATGYRNIDHELAQSYGGDWSAFKAAHADAPPQLKAAIADIDAKGGPKVQPSGSMYQVHLDVKPHELLDWDKPLSEQPKALQSALHDMKPDWTGGQIHESSKLVPGDFFDKAKAMEALKARGIKGIRYKDAGSRDGAGGTHNYVIFDDKLITILKKYGIPMTAGAGGAMLVTGQNMPPDIAAQLQQQ